jgi:DNA-binding MarR family transcriptional regulator
MSPSRTAAVPEPGDVAATVDYLALAELRHQIRRFLKFSEAEARAAGIEPQQHQFILAVKGLPEGQRPTIRTIAERLQVQHHTVVGLLDRLVNARLARRKTSELDKREILVEITPRGEQLLQRLALLHAAELKTVGPALAAALDSILNADAARTAEPATKETT